MKKRPIYFLILFCIMIFVFSSVSSNELLNEDPKILTILDKIKIDSAIKYVKELSGESNVYIDGQATKIASRYFSVQGNSDAEKYILQKFKDFNITTYVQDYGNNARNIIGVKKGSKYPSWKFIICAHFDSYSKNNKSDAPGADDNASGTAAVLEAARIFSGYNTEYTVEFALWDEEEIGLIGSKYYAQTAKNKNDTIMGVINLDMVAYDSKNDNELILNYKQNSLAANMIYRLADVNNSYNLNLKLKSDYSTLLSSDHKSFSDAGFPAVLLIEGARDGGDFNIYYHSENDKISAFNIPYYEKCLKLSILTLASLSGAEEIITGINSPDKLSNNILINTFPNPFNSTVNINFSLPIKNSVSLQVYDQLGREIETVFNGELDAGDHSFRWNPSNKPTGVYNVILKTNSGHESVRVIYLK